MISAHWSHLIHRPSTRARLSCAGSLGAGTLWYQAMRALVAQVGPPFRTRSLPTSIHRERGRVGSAGAFRASSRDRGIRGSSSDSPALPTSRAPCLLFDPALASVQLLVLQPEEGLQRFEDAGLLLADPGLPLVGVEALAHRGQLDAPARHHVGDALRDLRPLLEHALEGF